MTDYETAVRRWAAKEADIPEHTIEQVEFRVETNGCDTCGYGSGVKADVRLRERGGLFWKTLELDDMGEVIRGVLAAADEGNSR